MKLMTPEIAMENKQWHIRKAFQEVEDKALNKYTISINFVKMSESPPRVKWVSCEIGKDNDYIRDKYLKGSVKYSIRAKEGPFRRDGYFLNWEYF